MTRRRGRRTVRSSSGSAGLPMSERRTSGDFEAMRPRSAVAGVEGCAATNSRVVLSRSAGLWSPRHLGRSSPPVRNRARSFLSDASLPRRPPIVSSGSLILRRSVDQRISGSGSARSWSRRSGSVTGRPLAAVWRTHAGRPTRRRSRRTESGRPAVSQSGVLRDRLSIKAAQRLASGRGRPERRHDGRAF